MTKRLVSTLLWTTFLLGCGGSSPTGALDPNAQLAGSWHATLTSSPSGRSLPLDIFILQNGQTLSAVAPTFVIGTCSESTMNGSVSGNKVKIVFSGDLGDTVIITGTASGNNSISGSYAIKTSGCLDDTSGTLSAVLIPSVQSASWEGTTQSTQYPPGSSPAFTANLTEDSSGNITGVLTFTTSSGSSVGCFAFATGHVIGTQTGNQIVLERDNDPDGLGSLGDHRL